MSKTFTESTGGCQGPGGFTRKLFIKKKNMFFSGLKTTICHTSCIFYLYILRLGSFGV